MTASTILTAGLVGVSLCILRADDFRIPNRGMLQRMSKGGRKSYSTIVLSGTARRQNTAPMLVMAELS